MFGDEVRSSNAQHESVPVNCDPFNLTTQSRKSAGSGKEGLTSQPEHARFHEAECWKTANLLNRANNRLQELLQLLYLLGRDPAVPKDARHHVTVAQSEIALLARLMHNSDERAEAVIRGPKALVNGHP